jgi:hypothetical protein
MYSWPCEQAVSVAWCESRLEPWVIGGDNYGLFQINAVHAYRVGGVDALLDPEVNTRLAYDIWLAQGWAPWGCRP